MKNILIAIDFEDKTKNLLQYAIDIAKKFESKVWIIHIIQPDVDYVFSPENMQFAVQYINYRDIKAKALRKEHKMIHEYAELLLSQGIQSQGLLIEGSTVKVIVDEANKLNIDLIIMGSHKHSFLYNAFFKDTSVSVIEKVDIPILVIPL